MLLLLLQTDKKSPFWWTTSLYVPTTSHEPVDAEVVMSSSSASSGPGDRGPPRSRREVYRRSGGYVISRGKRTRSTPPLDYVLRRLANHRRHSGSKKSPRTGFVISRGKKRGMMETD